MSKKVLKKCIKCDETKELGLFKKDKGRADGCRNVCLTCHNKKRVGYNQKYKMKKAAKKLGVSVEMYIASRVVLKEIKKKKSKTGEHQCVIKKKEKMFLKQIAFENSVLVTQKECFMCNGIKSVIEFYPSKTHKDGYEGRCKKCNSLKGKKYRPSSTSRKRKQEYDKQYREEKKIENKEKKMKEAKDDDLVFTRLDTKMTAEVLDDASYKMKIYLMALMSVVHEVDGDVQEKILTLHEAMSAEVADVKSVAVSLEFCASILK